MRTAHERLTQQAKQMEARHTRVHQVRLFNEEKLSIKSSQQERRHTAVQIQRTEAKRRQMRDMIIQKERDEAKHSITQFNQSRLQTNALKRLELRENLQKVQQVALESGKDELLLAQKASKKSRKVRISRALQKSVQNLAKHLQNMKEKQEQARLRNNAYLEREKAALDNKIKLRRLTYFQKATKAQAIAQELEKEKLNLIASQLRDNDIRSKEVLEKSRLEHAAREKKRRDTEINRILKMERARQEIAANHARDAELDVQYTQRVIEAKEILDRFAREKHRARKDASNQNRLLTERALTALETHRPSGRRLELLAASLGTEIGHELRPRPPPQTDDDGLLRAIQTVLKEAEMPSSHTFVMFPPPPETFLLSNFRRNIAVIGNKAKGSSSPQHAAKLLTKPTSPETEVFSDACPTPSSVPSPRWRKLPHDDVPNAENFTSSADVAAEEIFVIKSARIPSRAGDVPLSSQIPESVEQEPFFIVKHRSRANLEG